MILKLVNIPSTPLRHPLPLYQKKISMRRKRRWEILPRRQRGEL
jgi:hypothetical protein